MQQICSKCGNIMTLTTEQPEEGRRFQCSKCHHSQINFTSGWIEHWDKRGVSCDILPREQNQEADFLSKKSLI